MPLRGTGGESLASRLNECMAPAKTGPNDCAHRGCSVARMQRVQDLPYLCFVPYFTGFNGSSPVMGAGFGASHSSHDGSHQFQ